MTAKFAGLVGCNFAATAADVSAMLSSERIESRFATIASLDWLNAYMADVPASSSQ